MLIIYNKYNNFKIKVTYIQIKTKSISLQHNAKPSLFLYLLGFDSALHILVLLDIPHPIFLAKFIPNEYNSMVVHKWKLNGHYFAYSNLQFSHDNVIQSLFN